jgi:hypothetical protein
VRGHHHISAPPKKLASRKHNKKFLTKTIEKINKKFETKILEKIFLNKIRIIKFLTKMNIKVLKKTFQTNLRKGA